MSSVCASKRSYQAEIGIMMHFHFHISVALEVFLLVLYGMGLGVGFIVAMIDGALSKNIPIATYGLSLIWPIFLLYYFILRPVFVSIRRNIPDKRR